MQRICPILKVLTKISIRNSFSIKFWKQTLTNILNLYMPWGGLVDFLQRFSVSVGSGCINKCKNDETIRKESIDTKP